MADSASAALLQPPSEKHVRSHRVESILPSVLPLMEELDEPFVKIQASMPGYDPRRKKEWDWMKHWYACALNLRILQAAFLHEFEGDGVFRAISLWFRKGAMIEALGAVEGMLRTVENGKDLRDVFARLNGMTISNAGHRSAMCKEIGLKFDLSVVSYSDHVWIEMLKILAIMTLLGFPPTGYPSKDRRGGTEDCAEALQRPPERPGCSNPTPKYFQSIRTDAGWLEDEQLDHWDLAMIMSRYREETVTYDSTLEPMVLQEFGRFLSSISTMLHKEIDLANMLQAKFLAAASTLAFSAISYFMKGSS